MSRGTENGISQGAEAGADASRLRKEFGRTKVREMREFRGEHTVVVKLGALKEVLSHCRMALGYDFLLDVSSVDNMGEDPRFEIVYELATLDDRKHLRLKAPVAEGEEVVSVVDLWKTGNCLIRTAYFFMLLISSFSRKLRVSVR